MRGQFSLIAWRTHDGSLDLVVMMNELEQILATMSVAYESSPSGRWVRLSGRCPVTYIIHGAWDAGYLVVCGCPERHPTSRCTSAREAISHALGGGTAGRDAPAHGPAGK